MNNECKTYKAHLHEKSTAISKELKESLFQKITGYLTTELEHQLYKNKLNSDAANNGLTQQPSMCMLETTVVSNLPKINCVLVSDSLTGKSTLCKRFIYGQEYVENIAGIYTEEHSTEYRICYNLKVNVLGGCKDYEKLIGHHTTTSLTKLSSALNCRRETQKCP
jgi:hypothetical protein